MAAGSSCCRASAIERTASAAAAAVAPSRSGFQDIWSIIPYVRSTTAKERKSVELSVLDFDTPGTVVDLVSVLDGLGYCRYWLGEHHSHFQCANPLLLGALLAGTTEGIRVGSGGV